MLKKKPKIDSYNNENKNLRNNWRKKLTEEITGGTEERFRDEFFFAPNS